MRRAPARIARTGALPFLAHRCHPVPCSWAEISYGGRCCVERARLAAQLVLAWLEERAPGLGSRVRCSIIGADSIGCGAIPYDPAALADVRLHCEGRFDTEADAVALGAEVEAL